MAMIKCKECGSDVSGKAKKCMSCGFDNRNWFIRNKVIIIVCFFMVLWFLGSIRETEDPETVKVIPTEQTSTVTNQKPIEKTIMVSVGDKIQRENMEITVNRIEFSYDVYSDSDGFFSNHYPAEAGKVYIHIDTDVKNLDKQDLPCDEIMKVTADYDSGYTYRSFAVAEDSSTGFTYSNITSIKPLETLGVRYLIECPQEVEESTKPLFLEFEPSQSKEVFKYVMR